MSCEVVGMAPPSTTWTWCTVVTTTVRSSTSPAAAARASSRSLKPPPFPGRAPSRPAATQPVTTSSTGSRSSTATRCADRLAPAIDRRGAGRVDEVVRVQTEERVRIGQAGHGHEHRLAVLQRPTPDRQLGRVRVGLERPGLLPGLGAGQPDGRRLRPDEVGDPPVGRREATDTGHRHSRPDLLTEGGLGGQHRSDRRRRRGRGGSAPTSLAVRPDLETLEVR